MEEKSRTMVTETASKTRLGDINAHKDEEGVKEVLYCPGNRRNCRRSWI